MNISYSKNFDTQKLQSKQSKLYLESKKLLMYGTGTYPEKAHEEGPHSKL